MREYERVGAISARISSWVLEWEDTADLATHQGGGQRAGEDRHTEWRTNGQRKHETGLGIFTEKSKAQEGVTLSENKLI